MPLARFRPAAAARPQVSGKTSFPIWGPCASHRKTFGGAYEEVYDISSPPSLVLGSTRTYYSFGGMQAVDDGTGLKYLLSDHPSLHSGQAWVRP